MSEAIERKLAALRVAQSVIVTKVSEDGTMVTVIPATQDTVPIEERQLEPEDKQQIKDVPCLFLGNNDSNHTVKPQVDSHGFILNFDYDHSDYIETGEPSPPSSENYHDYGICVFIPADLTQARRLDYDQQYTSQMANNNGSAGIGLKDGQLHLWGNVFINGVKVESVNAPGGDDVGTPAGQETVNRR